jgi:hypothetical protein
VEGRNRFTVDDGHLAILRGDGPGIHAIVTSLRAEDAATATELNALAADQWLVDPKAGRRPSPEEVDLAAASADAREQRAAGRLWAAGVRTALVSMDGNALDRFTEALDAVVPELRSHSAALALELDVTRRWGAVLGAEGVEPSEIEALARDARTAELPHVVIEATALLALQRLVEGDVEEATRVARRGSRMARTEALPRPEYMANLVLARVRRSAGMPHLAAHILSSLRRFAPPPWVPWIDFERALTGAFEGVRESTGTAARAIADAVAAAVDGRREDFDAIYDSLLESVSRFVPFVEELVELRQLLDPHRIVSEEGPVAEFLRGERPLPPRGFHGIGRSRSDSQEAPIRCVGAPSVAGRRVLAPGAGLLGEVYVPPTEGGTRRHVRTETALAVLALRHGEPLPEPEFFREVYGFELVPEIHGRTMDVLLHRVRQALGDAAELVRDADTVRLDLHGAIVVPDPRALMPLEDRILWTLAQEGSGSAKEAAQRLGVSVRTVQSALRALVESGACSTRRSGRRISYEVEDTTFTEPTIQPS